jgi:hydrogenase maturation protein HypF
MARIDSIAVREMEPTGESEFRIVTSQVLVSVSTGIPADAATFDDCLSECRSSRPALPHPFLNCTNCGPRFTSRAAFPRPSALR